MAELVSFCARCDSVHDMNSEPRWDGKPRNCTAGPAVKGVAEFPLPSQYRPPAGRLRAPCPGGTAIRLAAQRMRQQRIGHKPFASPAATVRWFGALQAQDYLGSLWAIGLRTRAATETSIERAVADARSFVPGRCAARCTSSLQQMRAGCEPVRPAHAGSQFTPAQTGPRNRGSAHCAQREGRDRCAERRQRLSRPDLYRRLESAGISTGGSRGLHLLWWHAHEGLICLGPRAGKQQTFVLLDEWLPTSQPRSRDDSLAELARRYFAVMDRRRFATSHGGRDLLPPMLRSRARAWRVNWMQSRSTSRRIGKQQVRRRCARMRAVTYSLRTTNTPLRTRIAALSCRASRCSRDSGHGIFHPQSCSTARSRPPGRASCRKQSVEITCRPFARLDRRQSQALVVAAQRYAQFLGLALARGRPSLPRGAPTR